MGYCDDVLKPLGYQVVYTDRPGHRGGDTKPICTAEKDGVKYFAFRDPGHYRRIQSIQHLVPHMARIVHAISDVILVESAPGQLLWEMDRPPDVSSIERSLYEFSAATHANGLIHGDVRPWNVVVNDQNQIRVIDWNLSCFLDDLRLGDRLLRGHFAKFHRSLKINEILRIDRIDAERIVALLRGQIRFPQAWAQTPSWYPAWCQH